VSASLMAAKRGDPQLTSMTFTTVLGEVRLKCEKGSEMDAERVKRCSVNEEDVSGVRSSMSTTM